MKCFRFIDSSPAFVDFNPAIIGRSFPYAMKWRIFADVLTGKYK